MPTEFENASFEKHLLAQIKERDAEIDRLNEEIARLEREIGELKKQKGISSVREGLTFIEHTGLWRDVAAGLNYCSTCLDRDKRNPMKSELPWGWRCSADPKHYFSNPDAPTPKVNLARDGGGGGGPQGWMGR